MRFASLTALLLVCHALSAPLALACSLGTFWPILSDSVGFFVGTATPDTVLAGRGGVRYMSEGAGHFGPTGEGRIRGQRIRVERLGGPAARGLPANVQDVVVVPWDYDPSCRSLPWGGSAQWVEPGTRGFYIAELRAPEHWVDGRPTFDLFNPGHLPYTATERIREMAHDEGIDSLLSLDQLFELYGAFPSVAEVDRQPGASLARLQAWVRAHPELARRPPAESLLRDAVRYVMEEETAATDHPVLGAWRFSLQVPGDTTYVFYGKTTSFPVERWTRSRQEPDPLQAVLPPAEGYTFKVGIHRRLDGLPARAPRYDENIVPRRLMSVIAKPDSIVDGRAFWRGSISPELIQLPSLDDPRVRRAVAALERSYGDASAPAPALYVRGTDGVLRFRQAIPLGPAEEVVFEGEQVSRDVIQTPK